jgi:pyrophosphatase PpaX
MAVNDAVMSLCHHGPVATRFSGTRSILFDVDGTLLDTTEFIFQAYEHATGAMGLTVPTREWIRHQVGRKLEDVYDEVDAAHCAELIELHRSFQETHLELSFPFEGTIETLTKLRRAGFQMAVVTSRSQRTSVKTLEVAGLVRYFPVVISAEDAPFLKPDPAPLRVALERMGQPKETAVMVGDAVHDVHAAQAFGIPVIAATYGFPGGSVLAARPTAFITDIRDLPALLGA